MGTWLWRNQSFEADPFEERTREFVSSEIGRGARRDRALRVTDELHSTARASKIVATQSKLRLWYRGTVGTYLERETFNDISFGMCLVLMSWVQ